VKRMNATYASLSVVIATLLHGAVSHSAPPDAYTPVAGAAVSFVACPVYRDTDNGRKSGCWLATDPASGVRYDIADSRTKPQIGHEVLIEGSVAAGEQACGAPLLSPTHVSVLDTVCPTVLLPAENYPGRRSIVSLASVLPPTNTPRPPIAGPFAAREWNIEFGYGSDFLQYQYSEVILDEIARTVAAAHPRLVQVVGYAVTQERIVSGHALSEPRELARRRAEMVALALERLGVARPPMQVSWGINPRPVVIEDGLPEPSRRRVEIHLAY
jgi:outer membrane protein OmpA-like peptidoglycan-associated protein